MKKKIVAIVLTVCLILSLGCNAFAADITASGSSGTTTATLTAEAATFSVTVPTTVSFAVAADGTVTCPTGAVIENASTGPVKVNSISVTGKNGWAVVANGTNFKSVAANSKQFFLTINGDAVPAQETGVASAMTLTEASWPEIVGKTGSDNGTLPLVFTFGAATQNAAFSDQICDIVITIGWAV